jgi:hypothetical protein
MLARGDETICHQQHPADMKLTRQKRASFPDKEEIIERVSNQLSNNRGEHRDTSADVGGRYEQAAWVLAPG